MNMVIDAWYKIQAWKTEREIKKFEKEQLDRGTARMQTLSFLACPASIEATPDGWYVKVNKMYAQALVIGKTSQHQDIRKGYDEDFSDRAVDELIKISATENAAILYGHIMMPLPSLVETEMLGKSMKKVAQSKEMQKRGAQETINSEVNNLNGKELRQHTAKVYNGKDHYYNYGLCAAVFGKTTQDVDELIDTITATLDECGIRYEMPQFGQLRVIKSILPTNFVDPNILQVASGSIVSKMMPLRAINPDYPEGIILGVDDTGKPVRAEFSLEDAGHGFIMGKTGSGKTVFECTWAARALAMGHRIIIMQPKDERSGGTDYKNFCNVYGGKLLRMPECAFNPFQVFFDPKIMGTSQEAYDKALLDHYETMKGFMAGWIGPSFKNRMKGMFIKTISDMYRKKELVNDKGHAINLDKWADPNAWPSFGELYKYWQDLNNQKFDASINALLYNTIEATEGCALNWIDNHNAPDLDNDLIVLDISALSMNLQNAFSVLMMGIINTRFFTTEDVEQRRTFVFFDEGAKLLKIDNLKPFIEKMFRESRSAFITTVFATQDPEGIGEDVLNFIKANCSNIFLLCNLKDSVIDLFSKVFGLKEEHRERLLEEGHGIALYLKHPYAIKMDVVLEDMVEDALKGKTKKTIEKASTYSGITVEESLQEFVDQEEFFVSDWVENIEKLDLSQWTNYNPTDPFSSGSISAWVKTYKVKKAEGRTKDGKLKQDTIGPEGWKHYCAVCAIYGKMKQWGCFPNLQIHHNDNADITWDGGCIEFEGQGTHNIKDFDEKKDRAEENGFKEIIFTGTGDTCKEIKKSRAACYVVPQGSKLLRKLELIRDELQNREPPILDRFPPVADSPEAY